MHALSLVAALAVSGPMASSSLDSEGAQLFFRSIPENAALLSGQTFDYHHRKLHAGGTRPVGVDGGGAPALWIEGTIRAQYLETGFQSTELYLEDDPQDAEESKLSQRKTFHSFISGEYVVCAHLLGATEEVVIERWVGLPKLSYLNLGLMGPPNILRTADFLGTTDLDGGLRKESYRVNNGKLLTIVFDPTGTGRLLQAESRAPNDSWTAIRYFEDHVPSVGDLPDRPTRIVEAKVESDGSVLAIDVWQAVHRLDPPHPEENLVAKGARVDSNRFEGNSASFGVTDRPMSLPELLTQFAGSATPNLEAPSFEDPHSAAPDQLAAVGPRPGAGLGLRHGGMLAALVLIGAALSLNKKTKS